MSKKLFFIIAAILFSASASFAQTSSFTFQGKLNDGMNAANGTYQFEFKLFDAASGGNQIGGTIADVPATVANGIFAVNLDFGAASFDGAGRFLEIGVRLSGSGQNYTPLNPRQSIASTPYAVKSLKANEAAMAVTADNALNLGGTPAAQFVKTDDARLSNARTPTAGSGNYIQNSFLTTQTASFNISGSGTAGSFLRGATVIADSQFLINNTRVIHAPSSQTIAVGADAGNVTTGAQNSFFGTNSGKAVTTGLKNTFVGADSGLEFTTGEQNVAVGFLAGQEGIGGSGNTFVGSQSGFQFGTNGNTNTAVGFAAGIAPNVSDATAIGKNAFATANDMIALGTFRNQVKIRGTLDVEKESAFDGKITLNALGSAGNTPLCRNGLKEISTCSGALAPAEIEKQRELNRNLQEQIKHQQTQIDALKSLVCQSNQTAAVCAAPKEK